MANGMDNKSFHLKWFQCFIVDVDLASGFETDDFVQLPIDSDKCGVSVRLFCRWSRVKISDALRKRFGV